VDEAEFRGRMDYHMTRGGEFMRELKDELVLAREEIRLSREQRVRYDALMDRMNQTLDRNERIGEGRVRERRRLGEMSADEAAATRAHKQAMKRLLDWIGESDPGDAPGTA
jgi:hypothetical protein